MGEDTVIRPAASLRCGRVLELGPRHEIWTNETISNGAITNVAGNLEFAAIYNSDLVWREEDREGRVLRQMGPTDNSPFTAGYERHLRPP
ncbi:uncharacterized protein G2W53_030699 [Senna tora]|uniref:Uncharacterized protein n=1 Tax=Senna tora TaxID=362788 RepID=A0A834T7K9_9FABA|nr:uncharacterized protein G2W53_030699 [Senna tora]